MVIDAFRDWARWWNRRTSLRIGVRAMRELLPGDPDFGDPLSTTKPVPAQVLARRAWALGQGRLSLAAEVGLAALQVADWLGEDVTPRRSEDAVAILFTDLVGFSSWALSSGDDSSLRLLRAVDAEVSAAVEQSGGQVVKRLGDGTMAVFDDASAALEAAQHAVTAAGTVREEGYTAKLRAGLHFGTPRPIGSDYIGIDVNIAARLCEAARGGEILVSGPLCDELDGDAAEPKPRPRTQLRGVPKRLETFSVETNGARSSARRRRQAARRR
jgi:adenylate cyclase